MIQLSNAGKRFGPKLLFDDLNWLITPRDRVGLVAYVAYILMAEKGDTSGDPLCHPGSATHLHNRC